MLEDQILHEQLEAHAKVITDYNSYYLQFEHENIPRFYLEQIKRKKINELAQSTN